MSTVRDQIVDAIKARLLSIATGKTFTMSDGVYTCTGLFSGVDAVGNERVHNWRKVPYSKNQVPAINFRDTDAEPAEGTIGQSHHDLLIEIEGHLAGGTAIETARSIFQDISAAIGSDYRWGGLADSTEIARMVLDVEQEGDVIVGIQIVATVTYTTPLWRI